MALGIKSFQGRPGCGGSATSDIKCQLQWAFYWSVVIKRALNYVTLAAGQMQAQITVRYTH
jgi:hypothetical protein